MFVEALREFEASVADVEASLNFVRSSVWLRPRLNSMLNWDYLNADQTAKSGAVEFVSQETTGIDAVYRGMYVVLAGSFEQLIRRPSLILYDSQSLNAIGILDLWFYSPNWHIRHRRTDV